MPRLDTRQLVALRILGDNWTSTDALVGRSAFYLSLHSVARILGQMAAAGLVERRGESRRYEWRLTEAGRAAL